MTHQETNNMSSIDYTTIALITIFTSLCTSIGKELGDELIKWAKLHITRVKHRSKQESTK